MQSGAVRCGGDGSRDRDVRERSEIVQGEATSIDDGREIAVADSGADRDGAGRCVEVDGVERVEGDLVLRAIRNGIEGVARAKGAKMPMRADRSTDLVDGAGLEEVGRRVNEIAGPVGARGG